MEEQVPTIRVFSHTSLWKSLLKRSFDNQKIIWALDADDLINEVDHGVTDVAILELASPSLVSDCHKVFQATIGGCQTRFFAVGNATLEPWLPVIRVCGFSDCCQSPAHLERFKARITTYLGNRTKEPMSVEDWVANNLPWNSPPKNSIQR